MNEVAEDAADALFESLLYQLREIKEDEVKEIYFHDTVHEVVDNEVSGNSRADNLEIIDETGHEGDIDEGMIDRTADITIQIAQIAYCCLETELFNDDFICERLQTALNNEKINYETAQQLIQEIENRDNQEIEV
jgi:hypothetical protein